MAVQYLRIQVRRDSKENWKNANPVLLLGEVGYETDTKRTKTGDGSLTWSNLPYDKAGIVAVGEGLAVDEDGVLTNNYDHSEDLGDLGDQTVKDYVDAQDAATLESAKSHSDAVSSGKASKIELEAEVTTLENLIADETNARQVNDNNLQGQINANYTEFTTYTDATGQTLSFLTADSTTQTAVDAGDAATLAAANLSATTALNSAVTTLEAKDAAQDLEITAAQTTAQSGVDKADTAQLTANTADSKADANAILIDGKEDAITVVGTGTVTDGTTVAGAITELETAVDANSADIALKASNDVGTGYAFISDNVSVNTALGQLDTGVAGKANVAVGSDGTAAAYSSSSSLQVAVSAIDAALKSDVDKMVAVRTAAQGITDSPETSADAEIAALQQKVNEILDVLKNATA